MLTIEDIYGLTPMQEGLLFHTLSASETGVYHIQFICDLVGEVDEALFEQSWQALMARHTILRTSFHWEGLDAPMQVVHDEAATPLQIHDWRSLPAERQKDKFEALLAADRAQGFVLEEAPLMRLLLVRLTDEQVRFVWSYHHLLLDGWSWEPLLAELFQIYEALFYKRPFSLPQPPPFAAYVDWLNQQDTQSAQRYWQETVGDFATPTPLPPEHDRIDTAALTPGDWFTDTAVALSTADSDAIRHFARRGRFTVNTLVQAAWSILLHRYSQTDDILFGVTTSVRPAELDGAFHMVGLLLNSIVGRVQVQPDAPLTPWLQHLQQRQTEARQYDFTPLPAIQKATAVPHGTPLFDSLLIFENASTDAAPPEARLLGFDNVRFVQQVNYPLTLATHPGQQIEFKLYFDQRRYQKSTVERLLTQLCAVLRSLIDPGTRHVRDVRLVDDTQANALLDQWNPHPQTFLVQGTLADLFEQQAARFPHNIAISDGQTSLTYRQLNQAANRLAHWLQQQGVTAESRVAVCLERSTALIVALLGILKAGGAYVPIDPDYPQERIEFIVQDSAADLCLSDGVLPQTLSLPATCQMVLLHSAPGQNPWADLPQTNPERSTQSDNLAYIIYTSGSTGQPKGVLIPHANVLRLMAATHTWYQFTAQDVWTLFHSYAFDFSVWEIWGALAYGGRLELVPYWLSRTPEDFYQFLIDKQVTVLNQTPSALRSFLAVDRLRQDDRLALRAIILGGEALNVQILADWLARRGETAVRLINMYGITETTVHVTYRPIRQADLAHEQRSPIGQPIPDQQLYLLDEMLQPVGVGVPGELYVGGAGLARGYLNRAALTAVRFIPDPFSTTPGARLYRSGDLAYCDAAGEIHYLGRSDQQVKIRGFRIELGEIEARLAQETAVQHAAVTTVTSSTGHPQIAAYVVCQPGTAWPGDDAVRHRLQRTLPDYMLPTHFFLLDKLPLTTNGKLDQSALPQPTGTTASQAQFAPPTTAAERTLANIWANILPADQVGIHDNFFSLGGDSIISIQIVAQAREAGLHLKPKHLFDFPTIAQLAAQLEEISPTDAIQTDVVGDVPLLPIQHWFFEHDWPNPHHYNQSMLLTVQPSVSAADLQAALNILGSHHDALRLRFVSTEAGWRQHNLPAGEPFPLTICHLTANRHDEQMRRHIAEAQQSLHLSDGPLARALFFPAANNDKAHLFITVHHLLIDGVSWRILLADLNQCLVARQAQRPLQLPPKTTAYQQWGYRLAQWAVDDARQTAVAHYQTIAATPQATLHTDLDGPNTCHTTDVVTVQLGPDETQILLQQLPRLSQCHINSILLAALSAACQPWLSEGAFCVGLEGHGRIPLFDDVDLSRTVGWFTSYYPVLLPAPVADNYQAATAIDQHLAQHPHDGLAYGVIRYLHPQGETLQIAPPVSFNYLGRFDQGDTAGTLVQPLFDPAHAGQASGEQGQQGERRHLLDITGLVINDQLVFHWEYGRHCHFPHTIAAMADRFVQHLRQMIASAREQAPAHSTYPLAHLPPSALAAIQQFVARYATEIEAPLAIADIYPASPMQEGLLFQSLLAQDGGVYVEQMHCTLNGRFNPQLFHAAWQQIVDETPILRTLFVWDELEQPHQVVLAHLPLPFAYQDWRDMAEAAQAEALQQFCVQQRQELFDFRRPPLQRLAIIRTGEQTYHLIWSHHHLLLDGWSVSLLLQRVMQLYQQTAQGAPPPSASLPAYSDYIAWLAAHDSREAQQFWQAHLAGVQNPTAVPGIKPHTAETKIEECTIALTAELTNELTAVAQQHHLTLNTCIQAAWALIVHHYSGETEIVFGSTTSGRQIPLPGIDAMLGLFINTIPARFSIDKNQPISQWLAEVQRQQLDRLQYSWCALSDIHRWSEMPDGEQLFDMIFAFENYPIDSGVMAQDDLQIAVEHTTPQTHYPLNIVAIPGEQLRFRLIYDASQMAPHVAARLLNHMQNLLTQMAAGLTRRVGELSLLNTAEIVHLQQFGTSRQTKANPLLAHQQFEHAAQQHPDQIAVQAGKQHLTYGELNGRANQLAHYLRAHGVGPESRVGICFGRTIELLVAAIGVLKAGAAYVAIDPDYPAERIQFMVQDSNVTLLLGQQHSLATLPAVPQVTSLALDSEWQAVAPYPHHNPDEAILAQQAAYVIYTSGSTGRPKGVVTPHSGLRNLIGWHVSQFEVTRSSRATLVAATGFDASVWEMWPYLAAGATLCLPAPEVRASAPDLRDWLLQQAVTHTFLPTPLAESLLMLAWPDACPLRYLLTGGDRLTIFPAATLPFVLINNYGPTENSVVSTSGQITAVPQENKPPDIGTAVDNVQLLVLDDQLQFVPVGVAGQLYLGGDSLARGYLGRPARTAVSFIPHPYSKTPGARLYATGDVVQWSEAGRLEFMGRNDHQVKIRGYRIETGEIEARLLQHPAVINGVVLVNTAVHGDKELVAVLTAHETDAAQLRAFLSATLPDYMVPQRFLFCDDLPLTPNGKIDRRALLALASSGETAARPNAAPQTELESELVAVWQKLLGKPGVGVTDDFFKLGGNSLAALRLTTLLNQKHGVNVPLAQFFQSPTIRYLARILQDLKQLDHAFERPIVPIQAQGDAPPLFMVHPGSGHVLCYVDLARHLGSQQPLLGIEDPALQADGVIFSSIEETAVYYLNALKKQQPSGPYRLGGWSYGGLIAFEMARQLEQQGEEVALLALLDSSAPSLVRQVYGTTVDRRTLLAVMARELMGNDALPIKEIYTALAELSFEAQLEATLELITQGSAFTEFNAQAVRRMLQIFINRVQLVQAYRPQQSLNAPLQLNAPLHLLRTQNLELEQMADLEIVAHDAASLAQLTADPEAGWGIHVKTAVHVHEVPGTHATMILEPHVVQVAHTLKQVLQHPHSESTLHVKTH